MFNLIKKRSSYLAGGKGASPSHEAGLPPEGIGEAAESAGGVEVLSHGELSKHHRKLADHHAGLADHHAKMAGEAAPSDEADAFGGEPAGATSSPHEKGLPHEGGPGHTEAMSGEDLEKILGGEESPAGEADETPGEEAQEKLGTFPEQGGNLRNSKKGEEQPLSRFAALRKKGKGK